MFGKSYFLLWLDEKNNGDVGLVGRNGARLGEMIEAGFIIPRGFIISSDAYFTFIHENKLADKIHDLLSTANYEHPDFLMQISAHIKKLIMHGSMREALVKDVFFAYRKLGGIFRDALVNVHASPTEQNLPHASSEGQDVKGDANLILKIKEGWASLFEPRAIIYSHEKKLSHFRYGMAIVVQKTVDADRSGIIFTVDQVAHDKTKIIIEAIYGSGKLIRKEHVTPDHYEINKANSQIINKIIIGKEKLTPDQILDLARIGKAAEKHYYFPQEIEWAIERNRIYIIQTRNITVPHRQNSKELSPSEKMELILKGSPASPGIVTGSIRVVPSHKNINKIHTGDILVTMQTNRDYLPVIRKAAAVVTDYGGRTSHAAIVSRDLGIPAIVGTGTATNILKNGMIVTVNGCIGEIYRGYAKQNYLKTATKVYADLGRMGLAAKVAAENIDGIGLLKGEAMMFDIGVHPKKLLSEERTEIYTDRLSGQLSFFCRQFAPGPVVYCVSGFKTNEYRELEERKNFEKLEDLEVFRLEIEAVKMTQQLGHKNLWMMLPFCRTVKELEETKRIMTLSGIHRSSVFKLWMKIEVPSNVILLDKFIKAGIDGVSIGLDNLTMLLLGIDPANIEISRAFDSMDASVLWAIERTIKTCHKQGISCSVSGRSISTRTDLLEKLVEWGISSVTVTPDAIENTRKNIFSAERRIIEKKHYGKN